MPNARSSVATRTERMPSVSPFVRLIVWVRRCAWGGAGASAGGGRRAWQSLLQPPSNEYIRTYVHSLLQRPIHSTDAKVINKNSRKNAGNVRAAGGVAVKGPATGLAPTETASRAIGAPRAHSAGSAPRRQRSFVSLYIEQRPDRTWNMSYDVLIKNVTRVIIESILGLFRGLCASKIHPTWSTHFPPNM